MGFFAVQIFWSILLSLSTEADPRPLFSVTSEGVVLNQCGVNLRTPGKSNTGSDVIREQLLLLSYSTGRTVIWCWARPFFDS